MRKFHPFVVLSVLHLSPSSHSDVYAASDRLTSSVVDESAQGSVDVDPLISKFPNLVTWFRSHGGTIDDRVVIGYESGSSIRGTIATSDVPADTVIMHIPPSLIMGGVDWCPDVENLRREIELGSQSKWYEYLDFDDSAGSRLPLEWDRNGVAVHELQGLLPDGSVHHHVDWYTGEWGCLAGREMTDVDYRAFKIILTRAMDSGLVPMYDLMNHHNGKINTYIKSDDEGGVYVVSLSDIPAGFPIYNTYGRSGFQSTNALFSTYGFVEDYPQLWQWDEEEDDYDGYLYETPDKYNDEDEQPYHLRMWSNRLNFEPNSRLHEVLVISPTLAALVPTKHLTGILGNGQLSMEEWRNEIDNHHAALHSSYVEALYDSAMSTIDSFPTTIEEDEDIIQKYEKDGKVDADLSDALMAIKYRLAFKKALRLAMQVAMREAFYRETDEL